MKYLRKSTIFALLLFVILFAPSDSLQTVGVATATSPAPGGVAGNLQLWLKADAAVESSGSAAADGQVVDAWRDQSGNSQDATQATSTRSPLFRNNAAARINGNPVVDFDGTDDRMDFPSNLGINGTNLFSVIAVYRMEALSGADALLGSDSGAGGGFSYYLLSSDNKLSVDARDVNRFPTNSTFTAGQPYLTALARAGSNSFTHYLAGATNGSGAISGFSGSFSSGNMDLADRGGIPFQGDIAEMIVYTDDKGSQSVDLQKIHSYLAVKYGMTLDSSLNYLDSTGAVIWNATTNAIYHNDVAGIGVDNGSALSQLTSRSINSDRIVTITGTLPSVSSGDFLLWGNNNGATAFQGQGTVSGVATANNRLGRIWKAQETGDAGAVTVTFENAAIQTGSSYCLLVDDDGNFTDGGTTQVACAVASSPVSFSHDFDNAAPFFTLGTFAPGTIAGRVFNDVNANGLLDSGESGPATIAITLFGPGSDGALGTGDDTTAASTTTNASGLYTFTNLFPGSYRVVAANPASTTSVTPDDVTVSVAVGATVTVNFADVVASSITGRVFADTNGNGLFDVDVDSGLSGVTIAYFSPEADGQLGTADDVSVASTTSGSGGVYSFAAVGAGSFSVVESDPDGYISVSSNQVNVALGAAGAAVANFADMQTGRISGVALNDANGNERQDAGESGLSGVAIALIGPGEDESFGNEGDTNPANTTTAADGSYSFSGVAPGIYEVVETDPAGYASVTANRVLVSVASGGAAIANFSDQQTGTVSGTIFDDRNSDGSHGNNEPGIGSVTVQLISTGPDQIAESADDSVVDTTTTDGNGSYRFSGVAAGNYLVAHLGSASFANIGRSDQLVRLITGDSAVASFGLQATGTVKGSVFGDTNGNRERGDNEVGLHGVTVQLFSPGPDQRVATADDLLVASATTDVQGNYSFGGVISNTYAVSITVPATYQAEFNPQTLVLESGTASGVSFPLQTPSTIFGTIYNDTDGNGRYSPGERGIGKIAVSLISAGNDGKVGSKDDITVATLATGLDGGYRFTGVERGTYSILQKLPDGLVTRNSVRFAVEMGTSGTHQVDFFNSENQSISGFVQDITNGQGLAGVPIELWTAGVDGIPGNADDVRRSTATTTSVGFYTFRQVSVGEYTLRRPGSVAGYVDLSSSQQQVTILLGQLASAYFYMQPTGAVWGRVMWDRNGNGRVDSFDIDYDQASVLLQQTGPNSTRSMDVKRKSGDYYVIRNVNRNAQKSVVSIDTNTRLKDRRPTNSNAEIIFTPDRQSYRVDLLTIMEGLQGFLYLDNNGNGEMDGGDQPIEGGITFFRCDTGQEIVYSGTQTISGGFFHFWSLNNRSLCIRGSAIKMVNGAPVSMVAERAITIGAGAVINLPLKPQNSTVLMSADRGVSKSYAISNLTTKEQRLAQPMGNTLIGWLDVPAGQWEVLRYEPAKRIIYLKKPGGSYSESIPARWDRVSLITVSESGPSSARSLLASSATTSLSSLSLVDESNAPQTIAGSVYVERNGSGRFDGNENGLGGVTLTLLTPGPDDILGTADDAVEQTTQSAGDGTYLFAGLVVRSYLVKAGAESRFVSSTPDSVLVNVSAGGGGAAVNFGRQLDDTVIGSLFTDNNGNGIRDAGDVGVAEQDVTLYSPGADGLFATANDGEVMTTQSSVNGEYDFSSVPAGTYRVTTAEPADSPRLSPANVIVTVGSGQPAIANFAFGFAASISGVVFDDANHNGRRDNTENLLEGVNINLKRADADGQLGTGDATTERTATTANGLYTFYGVAAGSYLVERDSVSGLVAAGPTGVEVSIGGSGAVYADFALRSGNAIYGTVYHDLNSDGEWNGSERGLEGVEMALLAAGADGLLGSLDDEVVLTTTTQIHGYYLFATAAITGAGVSDAPLPSGSYLVRQSDLDGFASTTPNDVAVSFASGGIANADFGDILAVQLSGALFDDQNGNGRQELHESGLGGASVAVKDAGGTTVASATTGADGSYQFTALAVLSYTVQATPPSGYAVVSANPVSFATGGSQQHRVSFAAQPVGSLRGVVYLDQDGNGQQNSGESGLGGVLVTLTGNNTTATTRPDGSFEFTNVAAGSYQIQQTAAAGFVAADQSVAVTMAANGGQQISLRQRVGGQIAGRVVADANGSGQVDGYEQGLAGVTVTLNSEPNVARSAASPATVTSDANGYYRFSGVSDGSYTLGVGGVDGFTASSETLPVDLSGAAQRTLLYQPQASVAGRVFVDADQDGALDENEAGIGGVTVELLTAGTDGILNTGDDVTSKAVTTTVNGDYSFAGVAAGSYLVRQSDASGYASTTSNQAPVTVAAGGAAQRLFGDRLVDGTTMRVARGVSEGATADFAPLGALFQVTDAGSCLTGIEIVRNDGAHPNDDASVDLIGGYWTIHAVGCESGFSGNLTLSAPSLSGGEQLCRYTGSAWDCAASGQDVPGGTVTRSGVDGFSDWAIGKAVPTGAALADFQAGTDIGTTLKWETLNETGLSGFHIWRGSAEAADTRLTDSLIGASGGLNGHAYTWQDGLVLAWGERVYYWLEMVETDGSSFSGPVEVVGMGKLFLPTVGR